MSDRFFDPGSSSVAASEQVAADRAKPRGGSVRFVLIVAGLAFLLGALAVGYGLYRFGYIGAVAAEDAGSEVAARPTEPAIAAIDPVMTAAILPAKDRSETPRETARRVAVQQGGIDQRLAAAEQRIARLDLQAQAASGNAARAEGLLIAFAVRRTLERGEELGLLGDQLRLRFGNAQPNAVEAALALAEEPVTRERLISRLGRLSPQLTASSDNGAVARIEREIGELFTFRGADADSPKPRKRLERARLKLDAGQIAAAVTEIAQLPGASGPKVTDWINDARRFDRAQKALDVLETTAILEPQRLRDAEGEQVEQPSPIASPVAGPRPPA